MAKPPSPQTVRLTIAVTPEVHAVFKRLAGASGMSISKAMGEWLGDTLEGAELMASKVEEARAAPRKVVRELHAMALGTADMLTDLMSDLRSGKKVPPQTSGQPAGGTRGGGGTPPPRSVIRGGKSPGKTPKQPNQKGKPLAASWDEPRRDFDFDFDFTFHGGDE